MDNSTTYPHLPETPCISEEQMLQYIDGKLSGKDAHAVERHMLDCPFCSDAFEGLLRVNDRSKVGAFKINSVHKEETRVIPLWKRSGFAFSAAAVFILVLGSVWMISNILKESKEITVAQKTAFHDEPAPALQEKSIRQDSLVTEQQAEGNKVYVFEQGNAQRSTTPVIVSADQDYKTEAEDVPAVIADQNVALNEQPVAPEASKDEALAGASAAEEKMAEPEMPRAEKEHDKYSETKKNKASTKTKASEAVPAAPSGKTGVTFDNVTDSVTVKADQDRGPFPLQASDKDLEISYNKGSDFYNQGKYPEAIAFFDEVLKKPTHKNFEDAQWKKAMSLLKLNRKAEAKELLQKIEKAGKKYSQMAANELQKL